MHQSTKEKTETPFQQNKIFSFYGDAKKLIKGEMVYPRMATCWISHVCNLDCPYCIVGEAIITMRNGEFKRIDEIAIGDELIGYDVKTGEIKKTKVVNISARESEEIFKMIFSGGKELRITGEHPIYTRHGYVNAEDIYESDEILAIDGDAIYFTKVEKISKKIETTEKVYNLECSPCNSFLANGIVVHNCLYAITNHTDRSMANRDKFLHLIDEFHEVGVESLELSGGGEPTVHPNIYEFAEHARSKGMKTGVITNAVKIKPEEAVKVFSWIRVGIDAATKEVYGKVKKPYMEDSFERVIANVKSLIDLRGTSRKPRIGIKNVINNLNYDTIGQMVTLATELKVDYIQFKPEHSGPNVMNDYERNLAKITIENLKVQNNGFINGGVIPGKGIHQCFMSPIHTVINARGDLQICCYYEEEEKRVGNVFQDGFKAVWNSPRHQEIIDGISIKECNKFDCRWFAMNEKMWAAIKDDEYDISFI